MQEYKYENDRLGHELQDLKRKFYQQKRRDQQILAQTKSRQG